MVSCVIAYIDLFAVNNRFIRTYRLSDYFPRDPVFKHLTADSEKFRVLGLPGAYTKGHMTYMGISTVEGFVDNELDMYRKFRGGNYQTNPNFMHGLRQSPDGTVSGSNFLDLLNVKYLVYRNQNSPAMGLALNKSYLPREFFVYDWEFAEDEAILEKIKDPSFHAPRKSFISAFQRDLVPTPSKDGKGETKISDLNRTANEIIYKVENPAPGIFITSDVYFPHWRVYVDGQTSNLLRVNYITRGVYLTAGKHEVRYVYESPWIRKGLVISLLSFVILIFFIMGYHYWGSKKLE
jgi:hypothetical protein